MHTQILKILLSAHDPYRSFLISKKKKKKNSSKVHFEWIIGNPVDSVISPDLRKAMVEDVKAS